MPVEVAPRLDKHTRSMLTDHMVFTPKFREPLLDGAVGVDLERVIMRVCREMDVEVIDLAVNPDHVHLFLQHPPKWSVSDIAGRLKGTSSRELREKYPELKRKYPSGLWSTSCFHGSVGHGVDIVRAYIQTQEEKHSSER